MLEPVNGIELLRGYFSHSLLALLYRFVSLRVAW